MLGCSWLVDAIRGISDGPSLVVATGSGLKFMKANFIEVLSNWIVVEIPWNVTYIVWPKKLTTNTRSKNKQVVTTFIKTLFR